MSLSDDQLGTLAGVAILTGEATALIPYVYAAARARGSRHVQRAVDRGVDAAAAAWRGTPLRSSWRRRRLVAQVVAVLPPPAPLRTSRDHPGAVYAWLVALDNAFAPPPASLRTQHGSRLPNQ